MKTDSLFYRLFKNAPELLLELADLNYADAHCYCFCSEEIKQTALRLDGILTPPKDNIALPLIFVEVQFQSDPNFYSRFFCEIFSICIKTSPCNSGKRLSFTRHVKLKPTEACTIQCCLQVSRSNVSIWKI